MAVFNNYLTSYKAHLRKHVKEVFTMFQDRSNLSEPEIKRFVAELTSDAAIPIPQKTFEWLGSYFKYVEDKEQMLVYDNTNGLWHFEQDETKLRNMLTDFFSVVAEEAEAAKDEIFYRYAKAFFVPGRLNSLSARIKTAIIFTIRKSADIVNSTENLRYFETTDGRRAILDMSKPAFNLKPVAFKDTQDLHLMHISPVPINTTDDEPKLWLQLVSEYMLGDQARVDYFHKVLAYLMSPYNYNQVMIYFIGESGRNGKSTVIKVLQDILGPHAVRMNAEYLNSQPQSSYKKDDALAATEGRSLLIFNEIDERMVASTQNIKEITEGGRDEFGNKIMTVIRPAYSRNYEVNVCGTPLVIANSLINFGDWSALDPIFKRLILVPFDFKIVKEDPNLLNKLAEEYPKIQAWLYLNYFKHKGIKLKQEVKPVNIEQKFLQYRVDSDIIGMFWQECVSVTANNKDEMLRSDLYRMYEQYCKANGRKAIRNKGTNGFQNLIEGHLAKATVVHKNGSYYVQGVKRTVFFDNEIQKLLL
jgi:P4 family phage/plasmid primase-like protien